MQEVKKGRKNMEERKRFTADEQVEIKRFFVALSILQGIKLNSRIEKIHYGKRDMGMVKSKLEKICNSLMDLMPLDQLRALERNIKSITYTVGIKKPIENRDDDYGLWLSFNAITALMEGAHDTCMMCAKNQKEQNKCPLRRGLDELPVTTINETKGECPYYGRI